MQFKVQLLRAVGRGRLGAGGRGNTFRDRICAPAVAVPFPRGGRGAGGEGGLQSLVQHHFSARQKRGPVLVIDVGELLEGTADTGLRCCRCHSLGGGVVHCGDGGLGSREHVGSAP